MTDNYCVVLPKIYKNSISVNYTVADLYSVSMSHHAVAIRTHVLPGEMVVNGLCQRH